MKNPIYELIKASEDYKMDLTHLVRQFEKESKKLFTRELNKGNLDYCKPIKGENSWYDQSHYDAKDIVIRYASLEMYKRGLYATNEMFEDIRSMK